MNQLFKQCMPVRMQWAQHKQCRLTTCPNLLTNYCHVEKSSSFFSKPQSKHMIPVEKRLDQRKDWPPCGVNKKKSSVHLTFSNPVRFSLWHEIDVFFLQFKHISLILCWNVIPSWSAISLLFSDTCYIWVKGWKKLPMNGHWLQLTFLATDCSAMVRDYVHVPSCINKSPPNFGDKVLFWTGGTGYKCRQRFIRIVNLCMNGKKMSAASCPAHLVGWQSRKNSVSGRTSELQIMHRQC